MPRTSKYAATGTTTATPPRWHAALYIRLSREDGDKEESNSVQNQRRLLEEFADRDDTLETTELYIDDGYTGTNFDRPGFTRMLADIRAGQINCVVVKDLSRFGRNYIEAGRYIEQLFPYSNVRFISVSDLLDSYRQPEAMNNLIVPFKNLLNDEYCRDISGKVRSTLDRKRRDGQFIGAFACYGYRKDPADKNHLLVDEEAAAVVREIFSWHLEGISVLAITRRLNERQIPNPAAYKQLQNARYRHGSGEQNDTMWHDRTIRRMLRNQMYIGNLVQGVSRVRSYKLQKPQIVPEEEWIVVEGTHEPIISREQFDRVQDLLARDTRVAPGQEQVYLFSGFLRCADCGKAMIRKKITQPYGTYMYYYCATYKKGGCTKHTIREDELQQAVLDSIRKQIELAVEMEELLQTIEAAPAARRASARLEQSLAEAHRELEQQQAYHRGLYEDWKNGDLTREEYHGLKAEYQSRMDASTRRIALLERQLEQALDERTSENAFLTSFCKNRGVTELSRDLLCALVDQILIHEGKRITIRFKFEDAYQRIADLLPLTQPA